jgi:hypothetical protein
MHTSFFSKNKKYLILAHYRHMNQKVREQGGVIPNKGDDGVIENTHTTERHESVMMPIPGSGAMFSTFISSTGLPMASRCSSRPITKALSTAIPILLASRGIEKGGVSGLQI